jgi:hypothetical protein
MPAPGGLGVLSAVQLEPFHTSDRVLPPEVVGEKPTAVQASAEGHDTPSRTAGLGLGVLSTVQLEPFQPSASVPLVT